MKDVPFLEMMLEQLDIKRQKKKKTKTKQNKTITYVSHVIQKVIKNVLQGFPCAGGLGSILGQGTRSHMPQ